MAMISGTMDKTQSKNINNLKSPTQTCTRFSKEKSKVPIYTNCEEDDVDVEGDGDGDMLLYMVMKTLLLHQGRVGGGDGVNFS
jgi:hypothetical protein